MCELLSWISKDERLYYLTDAEIFSEYGREKLKGCRDNDFIGHGAIRKFYDLEGGVEYENQNIWNVDDFPTEIAEKLKNFEAHWGRTFRTYLDNYDLCIIVIKGTTEYKRLAWGQFLKQSPGNEDLCTIVIHGPLKYKRLAWSQLLKQSPSNVELHFIIKYGTSEYRRLACDQLLKQSPSNVELHFIIIRGTPKYKKLAKQELERRQEK